VSTIGLRPCLLACVLWGVGFSTLPASLEAAEAPSAKSGYELRVLTQRNDAMYQKGDWVEFRAGLWKDKSPATGIELRYTLSKDGWGKLRDGKMAMTATPVRIEGTLDEAGFLRCRVEATLPDNKKITAEAAAAIDPLDIRPSLPVPDDFDAFWADQKKQLAAVPMKPRLTPVAMKDASVECFDVQVDCLGGKPVSGYFGRPAKAAPGSLPAILYVHGAGVRGSTLPTAIIGAAKGRLAMDINAHGIPNGQPGEYYEKLAAGELKDYRFAGRESRDTSYFRGMFLRLVRAIDFLAAQPEWDGKRIYVFGGSQGGAQAIVAAGLDARVTAFGAGVPAMCDHSGNVVDRIAGWPKLVPLDSAGKPDPKILEASRYFDAMNFAARTKAEAIFSVGFIDSVCPPTSVYAAYNNLSGRKQIFNDPQFAHRISPRLSEAFEALIARPVATAKVATR
jgi:cephalosporin-C deacetylase